MTLDDEALLFQLRHEDDLFEHIISQFQLTLYRLAHQYHTTMPQILDVEDLMNVGRMAVLEACQRYDASKGSFMTYASYRIRGAMIDALRGNDLAPVSWRKRQKEYYRAVEKLQHEQGHDPTDAEVAATLGISGQEIYSIRQQIWGMANLSLDELLFDSPDDVHLPVDRDTPEEAYLKVEKQNVLAESLERLTTQEQLVLQLYYVEDLEQKDIAMLLNLSAARISQVHEKAIRRLRGFLAKKKSSFEG